MLIYNMCCPSNDASFMLPHPHHTYPPTMVNTHLPLKILASCFFVQYRLSVGHSLLLPAVLFISCCVPNAINLDRNSFQKSSEGILFWIMQGRGKYYLLLRGTCNCNGKWAQMGRFIAKLEIYQALLWLSIFHDTFHSSQTNLFS